MDWDLAIEKEREKLKRIIALFYALAVLADRICSRSRALRCFVLWIMRPAVIVALDCIADVGPVPGVLLQECGDSLAEARRYCRCFRAAARSMKRELKALDRYEAYLEWCEAGAYPTGFSRYLPDFGAPCGHRFAGRGLLASLDSLIPAGLLRHASATGPPVSEPRDTF